MSNDPNLRMENYRIIVKDKDALTIGEARNAVLTIDRGLWGTEHGVLRDDVSSTRHDLSKTRALSKDMRERVLSIIDRFTAIEVETLNRDLLDDKTKEKGDAPAPAGATPVTPSDKGKSDNSKGAPKAPAPSDDSQPPGWFSTYIENFGATDSDGKPTKAAAKSDVNDLDDRVTQIENHLGREMHDGQVSFADRTVTVAGQEFKIGPTVWTLVGVWVALIVLFALVFGWFSLQTTVFALVLAAGAAALVVLYSNRTRSNNA